MWHLRACLSSLTVEKTELTVGVYNETGMCQCILAIVLMCMEPKIKTDMKMFQAKSRIGSKHLR